MSQTSRPPSATPAANPAAPRSAPASRRRCRSPCFGIARVPRKSEDAAPHRACRHREDPVEAADGKDRGDDSVQRGDPKLGVARAHLPGGNHQDAQAGTAGCMRIQVERARARAGFGQPGRQGGLELPGALTTTTQSDRRGVSLVRQTDPSFVQWANFKCRLLLHSPRVAGETARRFAVLIRLSH